ncbi:MAG: hypothetical protein RL186_946 [Pseudomonadota bacterium]
MTRPRPTALEARLAQVIARQGPMGVDVFMAQALYDPHLGYYTTQMPLGARGDFVTAPDISQMFGELIGLWLAQSWLDLGSPSPCHLIELGPGQGTWMADILRVGARVKGFTAAMQVHLIEANPHLQASQATRLAAHNPHWHTDLGQVPEGPTLLIANEFLDCLPIRQFVRSEEGWREKQVGLGGDGRLCFGLSPLVATPPKSARPDDPLGATREVAQALPALVDQVAQRLSAHVGRALFLDYGDVSGQAGDTLQALHRHEKVSPLDHIGQADLTAHVDFAALLALAEEARLVAQGPVSQRQFLMGLGIEARAQALMQANPASANDVQMAVERLVGEAHMGTLFKAVCLDSPHNGQAGPPLCI